jgi:anti-sigma factor RsiW
LTVRHPEESELIDYVRGDVRSTERAALTAHVRTCATCRDAAAGIRRVLDTLAAATAPPPVHWGRYRAVLREKLERRHRPTTVAAAWWRPVPAALAATLAAVLVVLAVADMPRESQVGAIPPPEDSAVVERLDLLQQYTMLERLDLLEDLEVIAGEP